MSKKFDFLFYLKKARLERAYEVKKMKLMNSKGLDLFNEFCDELNKSSKKFNFDTTIKVNEWKENPKVYIIHCDNNIKIEVAPYEGGVITMIANRCVGSLATTIDGIYKNIAEKIAESELPDPT